ncbi:unnamed protein product [Phytophthora lilii]|uniref:Unnamed protein product n=1 Tax=Phytophthora lilii TaxID=2077276 RepID=A0A9W6TU79_9STRA|nr:unnamed protein product [Phytophthora lilii]
MNMLWIRRRQEEEVKRKKDEEFQQHVQKWSMERSRDESEYLRKRESTRLVAGLGSILQEYVDQDKPFAWRSSKTLHPDLTGMVSQSNQSTTTAPPNAGAAKEVDDTASRKQPVLAQTSSKQPAQIVIRTRKSSVTAGGGMHFRNQLPPNYIPPGLLAAASIPKSKREMPSAELNSRSSTTVKNSKRLDRSSSGVSDDLSSSSEADDEDPATDENVKRKRKSIKYEAHPQMSLQSYHVPYYYSDGTEHTGTSASAVQKVCSTIVLLLDFVPDHFLEHLTAAPKRYNSNSALANRP